VPHRCERPIRLAAPGGVGRHHLGGWLRRPSTPTKSPTKSSRFQRSAETHETKVPRTCRSGSLLRPVETHETTTIQLPRWGSRVRIPSSAPEELQVRAGMSRPRFMLAPVRSAGGSRRGPVSYTTWSRARPYGGVLLATKTPPSASLDGAASFRPAVRRFDAAAHLQTRDHHHRTERGSARPLSWSREGPPRKRRGSRQR
jgi:hypothetical protein